MKRYLDYLVPALVVAVFIGVVWFQQPEQVRGAAAGWLNAYSSTTNVASSTTIGLANLGVAGVASSTLVLYSNPNRVYARITNTGVYSISCLLGSTATSTSQMGIVIAPLASSTFSSAFELNADNPYTGAVYCYAPLSTSTVSGTEN